MQEDDRQQGRLQESMRLLRMDSEDRDPEEEKRMADARAEAIQYISYGGRSSGKVRQHLMLKNYPPALIHELLKDLEDEGYLKDAELLQLAWAKRRGAKAESLRFFGMRMTRQGINSRDLDAFLASHDPEKTDALSLASYLRASQIDVLRELRDLSSRGERNPKLLNRLIRQAHARGFALDLILKLLRKMNISV